MIFSHSSQAKELVEDSDLSEVDGHLAMGTFFGRCSTMVTLLDASIRREAASISIAAGPGINVWVSQPGLPTHSAGLLTLGQGSSGTLGPKSWAVLSLPR